MTKKSISKTIEDAEISHDWGESQVFNIPNSSIAVMFETVPAFIRSVFADKNGLEIGYVPTKNPKDPPKEYIKWGDDNQRPYNVIRAIESDEVLAQNKLFNMQVCFGQGIRVYDRALAEPTQNKEIIEFCENNNIQMFFASVIQDMKFFCWSMSVVVLDMNDRIVGLRHIPVENVRLAKADAMGKIDKAYFANWREENTPVKAEDVWEIDLLDMFAPWKDLKIRMGQERSPIDGIKRRRSTNKVFGVICRFPIPGSRYYPIPPYAAVFKDDWIEIKKLTQLRLKAAIKNTNSIRYHVEILQKYWVDLWRRKGVLGNPAKEKKVQEEEYARIKDFLSDAESSGKALVSEYMMDVSGKESSNIKINVIDTKKQGGEWSDEITEACNMMCYADGIHPNLIGAVPGKTQTNNSGSDKRELFTMKQAMEDIWHQAVMSHFMTPFKYNGWWEEVGIDVPIVQLTTLDNHLDAISATKSENN